MGVRMKDLNRIKNTVLAAIPISITGLANGSIDHKSAEEPEPDPYPVCGRDKPVPIIVYMGAECDLSFITGQQDGMQVYVVESKLNDSGNWEVLLTRRDTETGKLAGDVWVSNKFVKKGTIESHDSLDYLEDPDVTAESSGSEEAQTDPEKDETKPEKARTAEHYIFFDPTIFADRRISGSYHDEKYKDLIHPSDLKCALAIQHGFAIALGKYLGWLDVTKKKQKQIEKIIHLVPLIDIPKDKYKELEKEPKKIKVIEKADDGTETEKDYECSYEGEYSQYLDMIENYGLDGTVDSFKKFWENNIAKSSLPENKKIGFIAFWVHGWNVGIDLYDKNNSYITSENITAVFTDMPDMEGFIFISCNVGDDKGIKSFASKLSADENIKKGVIATDGSIYVGLFEDKIRDAVHYVDQYDTNENIRTSEFKNKGFLLYKGGVVKEAPFKDLMVRLMDEYEEDGKKKFKVAEKQEDRNVRTSTTVSYMKPDKK